MKPLALIVTLALGLLTAPLPAEAQKPGKVYRIGMLTANPVWDKFVWLGMGRLPYGGGGRDIAFERRVTDRDERLPELAAELVRLKVDVIVASGTLAARAAKAATRTIPIVMVADSNPVRAGLVTGLARPGGNVTGVATLVPELSGKRLELLKEAVPGLSRVAVLWNPADPDAEEGWRETQAAARLLGLEIQSQQVRNPDDFASAFTGAISKEAGALVVVADELTISHAKLITDLARKHQLPAIYPHMWFVSPRFGYGGLMSYGPDTFDVSRRVVDYVDKILIGAKPADLPVERPTNFELLINLKTAQALGLPIPPTLLYRADRVIK